MNILHDLVSCGCAALLAGLASSSVARSAHTLSSSSQYVSAPPSGVDTQPGSTRKMQHVFLREGTLVLEESAVPSGSDLPHAGPIWNGHDPFHQPVGTTDYYGSGDVNADGQVNQTDAVLAAAMVAYPEIWNSRADVDGDGTITAADAALLQDALAGTPLPGWWNALGTRATRNSWIDRFLALDRTNQHPWISEWWQCVHFSTQLFLHGAGYGRDLLKTCYDGGQSQFNLPVYPVIVGGTGYGHAINAVLVGDDPLNFSDWRFIEPQGDYDVSPGAWDMPYGMTVRIFVPTTIYAGGAYHETESVMFLVEASGVTVLGHDPDLVLSRTDPPPQTVENLAYCGMPGILEIGSGQILFDRTRDDLSRTTDICATPIAGFDVRNSSPLTLQSTVSRLLDVTKGRDGRYHLLWKGRPDFSPGVFYGTLDPEAHTLSNITRLASNAFKPVCGRVIESGKGEIHAFWLDRSSQHSGVYWRQCVTSGWQELQQLSSDSLPWWEYGGEPDPLLFALDAHASSDGSVILVWMSDDGWERHESNRINMMQFTDSWSPVAVVDSSGHIVGLALSGSEETGLGIAYCRRNSLASEADIGLLFRHGNIGDWSEAMTIDASTGFASPCLTLGGDGKLLMAWQKKSGNRYVPVWSRFTGGVWESPKQVALPESVSAWYPTIATVQTGAIILAWSERSGRTVAVTSRSVGTTALTGDLRVLVSNAEGWGGPGNQGIVTLYARGGEYVAQRSTDSTGAVVFLSLPPDTSYSCAVNQVRSENTPVPHLYWGTKSGITVEGGARVAENFTRNTPYSLEFHIYDTTTNHSVYTTSISQGTGLRAEVLVRNPMYSGALARTVRSSLILDRDKMPPYDAVTTSVSALMGIGSTRTDTMLFALSDSGAYYVSSVVYADSAGMEVETDGDLWPASPDFRVVTGSVLPLPGAVVLLTPAMNAIVGQDSVVFRWRSVGSMTDRYWLEYGVDSAFTIKAIDSLRADTMSVVRNLVKGMEYYWRVRAHNATGWGPFSSVARFTRTTTAVYGGPPEIPGEVLLHQNFPNPFNPVTTIVFGLPSRMNVRIKVYNSLGEEAATLMDEDQDPGYHSVRFVGASLPSGMYFYRMQAGGVTIVRRLALIK